MGTGERRTPCDSCGGDGRVRKSKRISLTIPGGVEDGTRLRVSREGNTGRRGGPPGDLYVCVTVKDHAELRREGMTIYSDVSVRTLPPAAPCNLLNPRGPKHNEILRCFGVHPSSFVFTSE